MFRYEWKLESCFRCKHYFLHYFVCFYIDMCGCGRKKKGQAMQSRRVNEFPMSGQSVLLHYYLYQWE